METINTLIHISSEAMRRAEITNPTAFLNSSVEIG